MAADGVLNERSQSGRSSSLKKSAPPIDDASVSALGADCCGAGLALSSQPGIIESSGSVSTCAFWSCDGAGATGGVDCPSDVISAKFWSQEGSSLGFGVGRDSSVKLRPGSNPRAVSPACRLVIGRSLLPSAVRAGLDIVHIIRAKSLVGRRHMFPGDCATVPTSRL